MDKKTKKIINKNSQNYLKGYIQLNKVQKLSQEMAYGIKQKNSKNYTLLALYLEKAKEYFRKLAQEIEKNNN